MYDTVGSQPLSTVHSLISHKSHATLAVLLTDSKTSKFGKKKEPDQSPTSRTGKNLYRSGGTAHQVTVALRFI